MFDAFDESYGRLVRRRVFASVAATALKPLRDWPDLCTVLAVETIRSVNGTGKFLTSCFVKCRAGDSASAARSCGCGDAAYGQSSVP